MLRDPRASLEGTSFLDRVLGTEVDRDPFGVTHEAKSAAGELVHVRIVLPDPARGEANRLARAARVVAKGKPPALPGALAFGTVDGLAYLDLAPPRGVSIAEKLAGEGPLSADGACSLVASLARSLADIHGKGGFHGAIRPGATNLGPLGLELANASFSGWSPWRVALATALGDGEAGEDALDALASAAPEQLAARDAEAARSVAPQNDVYGLGVLLYCLLTGRTPYGRDTAAATIEAVLRGSPERPRKLVPSIPRGVEEVVLNCLAKGAGHRPKSALALAERLESPDSSPGIADTSDASLLALQRASDASGVRAPEALPRGKPWPLVVALAVFALVATGLAFALLHQRRAAVLSDIARGDAAFVANDFEAALAAFERARAVDPNAEGLGARIDKAVAAREASKQKTEARALLSKALVALPRSDTRIQLLEQAITLDPTLVEGHRERSRFVVAAAQDEPRGTAARKAGVARAREAVDALAAAGGKTAEDALLDAKVLALEKKDATPALERAVAIDGKSVAGSAAAAQLALRRNEPREASIAIERALASQPFDARLLLIRSRVRRALGEPERARTDLDAALAADPDDRAVRAAALDAALEARDLERARRMLDERPIDSERDPDLIAARGYILLIEGKKEGATVHANRALELDPACVRAKVVRGRLALQRNDTAAARKDLETADRDAPADALVATRALAGSDVSDVPHERVDVLVEVGQALEAAAERTRAKRVLDHAVKLAPDDARARLLRGQVLAGLQDFEKALADADHVLQRKPDDLRAHALRARAFEGQGRLQDALGEWTTLVEAAPAHVEFRVFRGLVLFDLKRFDESRDDLQLYLDTNPKGQYAERVKNTLDKMRQ